MMPHKTVGRAGTGPQGADKSKLLIGDVARKFEVSPRWLRHLERFSLLRPRRSGTARVYNQSDCDRVAAILTARKLGFTLAEIAEFAAKSDGSTSFLGRAISPERCMEQIQSLTQQRFQIEEAISELRRIHNRLVMPPGDDGQDSGTA
jgi:DNA-binding transcriptional MerR regulator